ncbi:hypothetical protein Tco_0710900 [Tanacetum coccineum]
MGETIRPLPLACEWEEIPEAFKAHIFPTLESYFNLAEWYNNQDKVVVGKNVYTVGERVRLGLQLKLRLLWRKNKNRIKAQQYTIYDSPEEAKNHLPPSTLKMKVMQDQIRAGVIPYKTDQEILDEVVQSDNRQNMSGMGKKLPGGGSTSRRRANQAFTDVMTREQMNLILRQKEQENELLRKQAEEAQQRAYLAALKADSVDQRA